MTSCSQPNVQKTSESVETKTVKTVDYVFTCDLVDDTEAQAAYVQYHSAEGVWPEVINACKVSGATEVKVFKQNRRLMLLIALPEDLSFATFDSLYNGSSPKMAEWGSLMGGFQMGPDGAEEGQTWVPMKAVFSYDLVNNTQ